MDEPPAGTHWSAAGPLLAEEFLGEVQTLLGDVARLVPDTQLPTAADHPSACVAVGAALKALGPEAIDVAADVGDRALTLLRMMRALDRMDRRLAELQADRETRGVHLLSKATARLAEVEDSVAELLEVAPELVCELGFDRALLSRVEDDVWHAELMYILGDPKWAAEIVEAGRTMPQPLTEIGHEATMVKDRQPVLVTGVRFSDDGRWGNQAMIEASRTRSYVAAPIVSGRQVIGILHADCYGQRRDVDEFDRELLGAFAQIFSLALERTALQERTPPAELHLERRDGTAGRELVIRTGQRPVDPLIASLTPREFEVLRLLAAGHTNSGIAHELSIADDTAKQHVKHILRKLQAGNRSTAVARYFRADEHHR